MEIQSDIESSSSSQLDAGQFFNSLEATPNYIVNCAFKSKRQVKINNTSFSLPNFQLSQIQGEYHKLVDKNASLIDIIKAKFVNVSNFSTIYEYFFIRTNSDNQTPMEDEQISITNSQQYCQFSYILSHYNIVLKYPIFGLLLLADLEYNYNIEKQNFINILASHYKTISQIQIASQLKKFDNIINMSNFIDNIENLQQVPVFNDKSRIIQPIRLETSDSTDVQSNVKTQIE